MRELQNIEDIKALQSNLRVTLLSTPGKEVLIFLEKLCAWYDFSETDTNMILINHGKRAVLATIKTLLDCTPEQIVAITQKEQ